MIQECHFFLNHPFILFEFEYIVYNVIIVCYYYIMYLVSLNSFTFVCVCVRI